MITKIKRIFKKIFPHKKLEEQKIEIRNLKNEIIKIQIEFINYKKEIALKIKKYKFNFEQSEDARSSLKERIIELNKEIIDLKRGSSSSVEDEKEIDDEDKDKKGSGKVKVKNDTSTLLKKLK